MSKLILVLMSLLPCLALAAIEIQINTDGGDLTTVLSNGEKARMNSAADSGYMLVDYTKQSMHVVMPDEKKILDVGGEMPVLNTGTAKKVDVKLSAEGAGPKIAGYATKKFKLTADGQSCGYVFGSQDAMRATGVDKLFDSMSRMAEKQRAMMGGYANMMGSCQRAQTDFAKQGKTIGIPMRTVDKDGKITSEVKSINTSASAPANVFELPKGYQTVTMAQQMQNAQQQMQNMQNKMPQMEQMMQQMQGSGQASPEAMQQMKRMQEMMKQYQGQQ